MKRVVVLLLGFLALAHAMELEATEDETMMDEEDECPRMMCRMYCPLGFHHDENGCARCTCIEDPCESKKCEEGEFCKPGPHCTGFPCYSMTAECIQDVPCAAPMCANECKHGYKKSDAGCDTCDCKDEEEVKVEPECEGHPCPEAHSCVTVKHPLCQLTGDCRKMPMCLPDAHQGSFLPHLPEHVPGQFGPLNLRDLPDDYTLCQFRKELAGKFAEQAKIKYGNSTMLRQLLTHPSMVAPYCTKDEGKFNPLQCHLHKKQCWCVNDRGMKQEGTQRTVSSKADLPQCVEHVTHKIEGMFLLQHQLEDAEPHLINIASVLQDHMAAWMHLDQAQILLKQVSQTPGGLIEVHFELHRTAENELHSAQLMMGLHLGKEGYTVPYQDTVLTPVPKSLTMKHHTMIVDGDGNTVELPEHGLYEHGRKHDKKHGNGAIAACQAYYKDHKVAVIAGGVCAVLFLIFSTAVCITLCKRSRVKKQFQHQKLSEKSKTYKENLAFANEVYGKQGMKPEGEEKAEEPTVTEA